MEGVFEFTEANTTEYSSESEVNSKRFKSQHFKSSAATLTPSDTSNARTSEPKTTLNSFMISTAENDRRHVDPRVALIVLVLLNVAVFLSGAKIVELVSVIGDAVLMIWCRRGRLAIYWLFAYALISLVMLGCLAAGPFFMPVGSCMMMLTRIFPTAMFAAAMISTTYLGEIACALQFFGLSGRMTVALCVGMRFFPTIAREARAVHEAMITRGIRLTPTRILRHPAMLLESFMVPYIHRISIVADELGDAVMARGVETTRKRSCYRELRVHPLDIIVLTCSLLLVIAVIVNKVCL